MAFRPRKHKPPRARRLQIEQLDQRITLDGTASAAAALPWFDPAALTDSFAPDGTKFGNSESELFATLASTGTEAQWQGEIERAFDDWLSILGTHITTVADSGDPFGTFGPSQGDSRFGDIRFGAVPLAGNVMAEAVPHSVIAQGSWAGDILLNSNADWSDLQQVYAVALHEIGHVLGLKHNDDPNSPMFIQGAYQAVGPTQADIAELRKLYAGVDLNRENHEERSETGVRSLDSGRNDEPKFKFDSNRAVNLQATLSSSARYSATGSLTADSTSVLYRLEPIGEIDHAEYLNITVSSRQQLGLIPRVTIYDKSGDPISSKVLHNSEGVIVIQAKDVEPNQIYYVSVTPAAAPQQFQVGDFDFFAEYSTRSLQATQIGSYALNTDNPIVEQSFSLSASRLVHVLVSSSSQHKNATTAVWGTLVDADNRIVAQLAMPQGETRSMPLVFLESGDYRLIIEAGAEDGQRPVETTIKAYLDEISIDVGPGVIDPTTQPLVSCVDSSADPRTCGVRLPTILVEGPVFPSPSVLPPAPIYPSLPPWRSPSWYYWPDSLLPKPPLISPPPVQSPFAAGTSAMTPIEVPLVVSQLKTALTSAVVAVVDANGNGSGSLNADRVTVENSKSRSRSSSRGQVTPDLERPSVETLMAFRDFNAIRRR